MRSTKSPKKKPLARFMDPELAVVGWLVAVTSKEWGDREDWLLAIG